MTLYVFFQASCAGRLSSCVNNIMHVVLKIILVAELMINRKKI